MIASTKPPADDRRRRYFVLLGGAGVTEGAERGVLPWRLHQQGRAAAQPGQYGLAWLSLTAELVRGGGHRELLASLGLLVPDPQFPAKTPAGRRPSAPVLYPAPGGQPVPRRRYEAAGADHPLQRTVLPVRSPGQHMHPQLRRPPGVAISGEVASSA